MSARILPFAPVHEISVIFDFGTWHVVLLTRGKVRRVFQRYATQAAAEHAAARIRRLDRIPASPTRNRCGLIRETGA